MEEGEGDLQACDGISVGVCGCVVGNGLSDSGGVHVDCEEGGAEGGIACVDVVHQGHGANQRWHVDLVEVQAPHAVEIPFNAGEGVDAEFGLGFDVFPGYHGDVLLEGAEVDDGLNERHALFQWTGIDEVGKEICLRVC